MQTIYVSHNGKMTTTATIRKSYGNRKSYPFPEDYPIRSSRQKSGSVNNLLKQKSEDVNKLIKYIDDNIVGKSNAFLGPFGRRKGKKIMEDNAYWNIGPNYFLAFVLPTGIFQTKWVRIETIKWMNGFPKHDYQSQTCADLCVSNGSVLTETLYGHYFQQHFCLLSFKKCCPVFCHAVLCLVLFIIWNNFSIKMHEVNCPNRAN